MNVRSSIYCTLALSTFFSGCASIVSETAYPVVVQTDHPDAQIEITKNGRVVCRGTHMTSNTLASGDGYFSSATYQVNVTCPGYLPATQTIETSVNGWYWCNFFFGGLVGFFIVDPITGAMWKIDDRHVYVPLQMIHSDHSTGFIAQNETLPVLQIAPAVSASQLQNVNNPWTHSASVSAVNDETLKAPIIAEVALVVEPVVIENDASTVLNTIPAVEKISPVVQDDNIEVPALTVEQRLSSLKELYGKELISKDVYERKMESLLDSL